MKETMGLKTLRVMMAVFIMAVGFTIVNLEKLHAASKAPVSQEITVVNINKADSIELQKLRGVGPSIAEKILQYRSENGSFKQVEDLTKIRGIGKSKFEKMKDQIVLD